MLEQLETIKKSCIDKWSNNGIELDDRLVSAQVGFDQWLEQIPESNRPTVLTLIQNLEYYSHKTVNAWLKKLHTELLSQAAISDENTIYVFIKSKYGKSNSSNDYWTEYKAINKLNTNTCIENMDALEEEDWQYIQNVVFIDDFSGSGKSFIDELKRHPDRYKGKNVYFVAVNIMISAVGKINEYCKKNEINVVLLSAFSQEKAFERGLFDNDEEAKAEIRAMSSSLQIPKEEALGYHKGQALVAFYNNTPNNTLGFIRYDTDQYRSLFPRKNESVPTWMKMKRDRLSRSKTNYANKLAGVNNE